MFYFPQLKRFDFIFFRIEVYRTFAYLATLVGIFLVFHEAKKRKLNKRDMFYLILFSIVGIIAGARLFYYFGPWTWNRSYTFFQRIIKFFMFWRSGLVLYGGLLGAVLSIYSYCKFKKINFWKYSDVFALYFPIILSIARLGCFVSNDSCRGKPTNLPWAIVRYSNTKIITEPLHPARLYIIANLLVLFFILRWLDKKKRYDGFLTLFVLMYYSATRFAIEFFRSYNWYLFGFLTASQIVSIFVFSISFFVFYKKNRASF